MHRSGALQHLKGRVATPRCRYRLRRNLEINQQRKPHDIGTSFTPRKIRV
jgi:hypothetical protein